jgi:hypothetical protein
MNTRLLAGAFVFQVITTEFWVIETACALVTCNDELEGFVGEVVPEGVVKLAIVEATVRFEASVLTAWQ